MRVFKFKEINSTNSFLKNLEHKEDYDIAIAETQNSGRGRRGNKWHSTKGGGYFSFILKENKDIQQEEYTKLPLVVGYSLLKTFENLEPELKFMFKWTNDIYIKDKKLSGILVEKKENNFIIGIGINFNNEIDNSIENIGISLKNISSKTYDINKIILEIVENFKQDLNFYFNGNFDIILKKLNNQNYLYNKRIDIDLGFGKIIEGRAKEIDKTGQLKVEVDSKLKLFNVGEIHICKK